MDITLERLWKGSPRDLYVADRVRSCLPAHLRHLRVLRRAEQLDWIDRICGAFADVHALGDWLRPQKEGNFRRICLPNSHPGSYIMLTLAAPNIQDGWRYYKYLWIMANEMQEAFAACVKHTRRCTQR